MKFTETFQENVDTASEAARRIMNIALNSCGVSQKDVDGHTLAMICDVVDGGEGSSLFVMARHSCVEPGIFNDEEIFGAKAVITLQRVNGRYLVTAKFE